MTFYFSVHSHEFQTEVISFCSLDLCVATSCRGELEGPFQEIFLSTTSRHFSPPPRLQVTHTHTHTLKKKKKSLSLMRRLQRGDKKGAFIYVLLLKGLEGIWRVCFFPPLSLSLARSLFFEIGFTRRRAVSLHL